MPELGTPNKTIEIIHKHNFAIQKKYGQNFLTDPHVLESIVDAAQITKDDVVLEIGPGLGNLTCYLLEAAKKVIAVEVDRMLIPILQENLASYDNFRLIHADILKVDLDALIEEENDGRPIKVVANLPYYITTPIVMELLERGRGIRSITVMVQKEVAARMQEGPGSKDYGALSLAVQYYARAELMMIVSRNCFIPKPNVDSAVIRLSIYEDRPVAVKNEKRMFDIIRASFNQRRKTLVNTLTHAPQLGLTKEQVTEALAALGRSESIRGEVLTLEEFAKLSDLLQP